MEITKMHGLGNSQILLEDLKEELLSETNLTYSQIARALCNENFGIGGDQTLIILPSDKADYKMRVFNRDGGEAEMCGNGIRCVAKYLLDKNKVKEKLKIETKAGKKYLEIREKNDETQIKVGMGKGKILERNKKVEGYKGSYVSVGNPHFVIFSDKASEELARGEGPKLEIAEEFQPEKTNVEFVKLVNDNMIETYVWERGAGLTLACGTGACATAFAANKMGKVNRNVKIKLLGGVLNIKIEEDDQIWMTGPAEYILKGEIYDISKIHQNVEKLRKTS